MSEIFISYASEDLERVKPIVEALALQGWAVWWDRKASAVSALAAMASVLLTRRTYRQASFEQSLFLPPYIAAGGIDVTPSEVR